MKHQTYDGFEEHVSAAVASHGRWKKRLLAAIDTGESEWTPEFVESCHNCQFGQWLDSVPEGFQDESFTEVFDLN
jgi:hypothetical protein